MQAPAMFIMEKPELNRLIQLLRGEGYRVVGPVVRDGAITYDDVESTEQLPRGWTQHVGAGAYRLERRDDDALFGYAVGPQSWKKYLFPPRLRLFSITRDGREVGGYRLTNVQPPAPRLALIGVRACELAALDLQDRVFAAEMADPYYTAVRREAIIIAVNCTEPGGTCFCDSMNTGPSCRAGYDLALTELDASFAVQAGSARGEELLKQLSHQPADHDVQERPRDVVAPLGLSGPDDGGLSGRRVDRSGGRRHGAAAARAGGRGPNECAGVRAARHEPGGGLFVPWAPRSAGPDLRLARTQHALRHRPVRALSIWAEVRLQGRPDLLVRGDAQLVRKG